MNVLKAIVILFCAFSFIRPAYSGSEGSGTEDPSKTTLSNPPVIDNNKPQLNQNGTSSARDIEAENLQRANIGLDPIPKEPSEEDCARFRAQREALKQALQNPGAHPNTSTQLNISVAEAICMQRENQAQSDREAAQSDHLRCASRPYRALMEDVRALQTRAYERWAEREVACSRLYVDSSNAAGSLFIPFFFLYAIIADSERNAARLSCQAEARLQLLISETKLSDRCQGSDEKVDYWQAGDVRYSEIARADRAVCSAVVDYFNSCPAVPMSKEDESLLAECQACGYAEQDWRRNP